MAIFNSYVKLPEGISPVNICKSHMKNQADPILVDEFPIPPPDRRRGAFFAQRASKAPAPAPRPWGTRVQPPQPRGTVGKTMGKPWENGEKHGNMVIFTKENAD